MKSFEWYKDRYGDGQIEVTSSNTIDIPKWLVHYILDSVGLKSKKTRIQKKVLKREVNKALLCGIESMKESKYV